MKRLTILMIVLIAMVLVGCNITTPKEPSAKVTITSVSGYLWQTKGAGIELSLTKVDCTNVQEHDLYTKVSPSGSGSATGGGDYCPGEVVSISASPNSGFEFDFWTPADGGIADEKSANTTFTMPDHDSTVTAHFKDKPSEECEECCTPEILPSEADETVLTWWICDVDTGIPATGPIGPAGEIGPIGPEGDSGEAGNTPYIQDGTWWIDGVDTGILATGPQGETGPQGPQGPAGQDLTLPDSIYVYYTIKNIGNVDIQEYTIYFDAETNKGVYTGIATGEDLAVGATVYSYVEINVFSNEVTFIDYNLELQ